MNPESSQPSPDDREARLTALLLGELPVAEAESLRAEIAADAELA
jgi:anti-sigma factor RsiW